MSSSRRGAHFANWSIAPPLVLRYPNLSRCMTSSVHAPALGGALEAHEIRFVFGLSWLQVYSPSTHPFLEALQQRCFNPGALAYTNA